jgi:S1-C subfamily serine protease
VGREVTLSAMRDGRKVDLRIKPEAGRSWFDPRFGESFENLMEGVRERVDRVYDSGGARSRGRLGASVQELTGDLPDYFGVKSGVLVTSVHPETPAAKAGLKAGDVITAVNGKTIASRRDLVDAIPESGTADLDLTVMRQKKELTLRASL